MTEKKGFRMPQADRGEKQNPKGFRVVGQPSSESAGGRGKGFRMPNVGPNTQVVIVERDTSLEQTDSSERSSRPLLRRDGGSRKMSFVRALGTGLVADVLTTQAGEPDTLADRLVKGALRGVRKLYKSAGLAEAPAIPMAQEVQKERRYWVRQAKKAVTTSSGIKVLGDDGIQKQVIERSDSKQDALMNAVVPIGSPIPKPIEIDIAEKAVLALEEGKSMAVVQHEVINNRALGVVRDAVLAELKAQLGEDAQVILDRIVELRESGASTRAFVVDPLTKRFFEDRTPKEDKKLIRGVTWSFDTEGITFRIFRKTENAAGDRITKPNEQFLPWELIAFKGDPLPDTTAIPMQFRVNSPRHVDVLQQKTGTLFRVLVNALVHNMEDHGGELVLEPAVPLQDGEEAPSYPPLIVRSPKVVIDQFRKMKALNLALRQSQTTIKEIVNQADPAESTLIRPQIVRNVVDEMWGQRQIKKQIYNLDESLAQLRTRVGEYQSLINANPTGPNVQAYQDQIRKIKDRGLNLWNQRQQLNTQLNSPKP